MSTMPKALRAVSPQTHYIAIAKTAMQELRALGLGADGEDWQDLRNVLVAAIAEGAPVKHSVRACTPPKPQPHGTGLMIGYVRWAVSVATYPLDLELRCRVVTGSPAGWQPHTLIVQHVYPRETRQPWRHRLTQEPPR